MMDIVKVFLLKYSQSEIVLINNIVFSEDNYNQIERTIGADLLRNLDVVCRTIRLLSEEAWCADACRKGMQIGWSVPDLRMYGSVPEDGENADQDITTTQQLKVSNSIGTEETMSTSQAPGLNSGTSSGKYNKRLFQT